MKTLVIVESPAKAKTIEKFLGKDYYVKSSFGHIRDLPKKELGIDTENNFEPKYSISRDKMKVVKELKDKMSTCDQVLFATDEDREGEAISWHLANALKMNPDKIQRITFHEITKDAISEAIKNPRPLDMQLVNAQQARRVLDRLVGYKLSPFLWKKIARGLSAGRVQSVAVRLIVEREREIKDFIAEEYWSIEGHFKKDNEEIFSSKLILTPEGKIGKMDLKNEPQVKLILDALSNTSYKVTDNKEKLTARSPLPPFITSTLQQEANHRLGFSAKQTMRVAQQLYEGVDLGTHGSVGLITYMRTDSTNLSDKFLNDTQSTIVENFGKDYLPEKIRYFKTKSKSAQEAHEAIRPTEAMRDPESVKAHLDRYQYKLYDLIWRRAIASQMSSAKINNSTIDISSDNNYVFRANGQNIVFDGFLKLYPEKTKENFLPKVTINDSLKCEEIKPEQHFTEPPARYSDATLVKALEEYEIGRPSTYAPTIATIEDRGYVERDEKKKLFPKEIAYLVNDLLVEHFPNIVDFKFTAGMEENLDSIAEGKNEWQPIIADFYHPFEKNLTVKDKELSKKELTEEKTDEVCDRCGQPMIIKVGRFGRFIACSGYPECKNTKPYSQNEKDMLAAVSDEATQELCDKCQSPMVKKIGRFGPFISCSNYPKCKNIKGIEIKLNLKCPKCSDGDIVQKKSRRGKIFYGCSAYPKCDFALWDKPTSDKCPICQASMIEKIKGDILCSNKECSSKTAKKTKKTTKKTG